MMGHYINLRTFTFYLAANVKIVGSLLSKQRWINGLAEWVKTK